MALHRKLDALMALCPDVAVISECADPHRLRTRGVTLPADMDMVWIGSNPDKGLGVFGFNGCRVQLDEAYNPRHRLIAPVRVSGSHDLNLLAVWAQNANDGIRRKDEIGPLRLSIEGYRSFLKGDQAVIAGDFNNHIYWDRPGWAINHQNTIDDLAQIGLVSGYHARWGIDCGEELHPTHYWRDRTKDGPRYHIDYIFLPSAWLGPPGHFK